MVSSFRIGLVAGSGRDRLPRVSILRPGDRI
ncbi:hypothetical protein QO014_000724 [Kaistia dalseonensis]|uniref:Uncharacterized protein n=1 Tax=Kaistia dalseonensis TaxID=410840 RepID=A0ABU0H215_9HYPH|nr:hypothetical protein [Kaistia dalseonensis]